MANIERKQAKTINLGLFYGMGKAKLQQNFKLENKLQKNYLDNYHDKVPFVKGLTGCHNDLDAQKDGEIQTIAW